MINAANHVSVHRNNKYILNIYFYSTLNFLFFLSVTNRIKMGYYATLDSTVTVHNLILRKFYCLAAFIPFRFHFLCDDELQDFVLTCTTESFIDVGCDSSHILEVRLFAVNFTVVFN